MNLTPLLHNQLTFASGSAFSYDANGNRNSTGYATSSDNELTNDGTWTYTYDQRGNVAGKSDAAGHIWTYTYDNNNELTTATESSGGSVVVRATYSYDAFGNRIESNETQGGVTTATYDAYDGWNPAKGESVGNANFDVWAEFTGGGSLTTRYVRGDAVDQVFAQMASSGTPSWLLTDHLGSVVGETSSTGVLQLTMVYDAFGNMTSTVVSGSPMPVEYQWEGLEKDAATGLYYDDARFYNSAIGRPMSQDPLGFAAGDSNLYRYVNNEPTNATDPSGLDQIQLGAGNSVSWSMQADNGPTIPIGTLVNNNTVLLDPGIGGNGSNDFQTSFGALQSLAAATISSAAIYDGLSQTGQQAQLGTFLQGEGILTPAPAGTLYTTNIVAKSFINGVGPIGSLGFRTSTLTTSTVGAIAGLDAGINAGNGALADARLNAAAIGFAQLPAFNQNPRTDAKDGQYRLYTRATIDFLVKGNLLLNPRVVYPDKEGGQEGSFIYGTIYMSSVHIVRVNPSTIDVWWLGWGSPNPLVEPGMLAIADRTSVNIWHQVDVELSASNGKGFHKVVSFLGSAYPSRRLWINGVIKKDIPQQSLSSLWTPDPTDPTFVAQ